MAMNKCIAFIILALSFTILTSCDKSEYETDYYKIVVSMEIYDSNGNNLLDKSCDKNIINSDIRYCKNDGAIFPISWTGEHQTFPPNEDPEWEQLLYYEKYCCIEFERHEYIYDFESSFDLILGEYDKAHRIVIHHKKKSKQATIFVDGIKVQSTSETIGGAFYETFRLILPAKH